MSLTPDQRQAIDGAVRRHVAASAIKQIHRLIEEEKADDLKGRRFAAVATSVLLLVVAVPYAYIALGGVLSEIVNGAPSPAAHMSGVTSLFFGVLLTTCVLWLATYLAISYPKPMRRFALFGSMASLGLACSVSLVYFLLTPVNRCSTRADTIRPDHLNEALLELSSCLSSAKLTSSGRADALRTRALANYRAGHYVRATQDMESAFQIEPPSDPTALTEYAIYLRRVGRLDDSLGAIEAAARIASPETSGRITYQRGLILAALGRHKEAIGAFSEIVKHKPSAVFAYWNRGLAYEATGDTQLARADFARCEQLLSSHPKLDASGAKYLQAAREKLRQQRQ